MGKVNIDFTPTKYSADDAPDLVTGAYNQSMDDLKIALDNATAEDGGGGDVTYPIPIDKGGTNANNAADALFNLGGIPYKFNNTLSADSDLNDFISVGYFSFIPNVADTLVNKPKNAPTNLGGALIVDIPSTSYLRQTLIYRNGKKYERGFWVNSSVVGVFDSWTELPTIADLANYLPLTGGTLTGALTLNTALGVSSGGTGANTAEQARENLGIVDPTPVYVETEETSEPGLHIIVDSENNVLKVKKV